MSEISKPALDLDLFGQEVKPLRDRRGRPSFAKSKENQQFVMTLRAAGWSQGRIAEQMGCDEKTLRKYFSRELSMAADHLEAEALQVIYAKMRQGNISAARTVRQIVQEAREKTPFSDFAAHNPAPGKPAQGAETEAEAKLGKKEQLSRDAQTPSGAWAKLLPN